MSQFLALNSTTLALLSYWLLELLKPHRRRSSSAYCHSFLFVDRVRQKLVNRNPAHQRQFSFVMDDTDVKPDVHFRAFPHTRFGFEVQQVCFEQLSINLPVPVVEVALQPDNRNRFVWLCPNRTHPSEPAVQAGR